ncbi:response regulator [Fluviispira multicolorata]|uniref:Response regulator n=1 Tax=Fluviispira multicolorata TaxID=2654512 RepID=A0A833JB13_9BACT|nr:response regulator [Fluviispira multicolorata]KAB8028050.1 response regulator [Fluviispira multicolorata]
MASEFSKDLDKALASQILKNVSTGIALFNAGDRFMYWCNATFKKQTWFGGAGKSATKVNIDDLFDTKDHALIYDLFNIAMKLGQAYDFQRQLRRGPVGSFPAEVKLHKITIANNEILICMEISDLSLTKMYDELQSTHAQMREKLADLMTTQAELHYSVRMNTISEIGADIAHQLINPITMCRGILQTQILPVLNTNANAQEDLKKALQYMQDIQDLAVWFRKFSNPKLSETQITNVMSMVDDALMLNVHRFTTQGITYKIRKDDTYDPNVLANPVNFIMWLNAAFAELCDVITEGNSVIYLDINGNDEFVTISAQCSCIPGGKQKVETSTLEKFANKMPGSAKFEAMLQESHILFSLALNCFQEEEPQKEDSNESSDNITAQKYTGSAKPLVLIVDDESDIRRLVKRGMKQAGWESVEAEDGLQALEYFQQEDKKAIAERIVAIISDVRMPRMTGPHFLVALREEKINTPFIFFSSNIVDQGDGGFKYENVFYMTKESGLDELKKIVARFMPAVTNEDAVEVKS